MRRLGAFVALTLVAAVLGLSLVTSERINVVFFRGRPWVLKFGPAEPLGRCRVRETADPASDVLSNLVDLDSDGRSELRTVGFIDGSKATCERRAFLGFWREVASDQCRAAAEGCSR